MTAEHFVSWLRGYSAALAHEGPTRADWALVQTELAKVGAPPSLSTLPPLGVRALSAGSLHCMHCGTAFTDGHVCDVARQGRSE